VILTVTAFDASGAAISDLADRSIVWASGDPTTATVAATDQPAQELVTGVNMGKTSISATVDGVQGTAQLTVQPEFGYFNTGGYEPTLDLGDVTFLSLNFVSANGERGSVIADQWVSTNPAVLTVTPRSSSSSDVNVNAVGLGTASIEATYRGFTLTATITVVATVARIDVFLPTQTLTVGQTIQATAVLYNDRGRTFTVPVTWTAGTPGVVSISNSGVVTAVAPGITSINATAEGVTGTAFIEVVPR
jgi:large repetitive protein